jgi:hypothetical protein
MILNKRLVFTSVRTDSRSSTITAILQTSRENNPRDGVTGALLSDGDHFVQLLEGDPAGLDRCFSRIRQDDRHRDVSVLVSEETDERLFPEAAMQGMEATDQNSPVAAALSPRATPAVVMEAFEALAQRSDPGPARMPGTGGPLIMLQGVHQAARRILDDHLTRPHVPPETLARLRDSLARQAVQARELHRRLETTAPADPEHGIEALHLCELLEAAGREVDRRLDRAG